MRGAGTGHRRVRFTNNETRDFFGGSILTKGALAAAFPEADARGIPRPVDGNGDGLAACDVGAAELLPEVVFASGFEP